MTGSAPIEKKTLDFLKMTFCCPIIEGYGQTESSALVTATWAKDVEAAGTVGGPVPCNYLKLVDVPDMNYLSSDEPYPRGEICLKGYNVFKGYFKNSAKTAEVIDEQGWLHTGDIGMLLPNGALKIIDRMKNIFKLM